MYGEFAATSDSRSTPTRLKITVTVTVDSHAEMIIANCYPSRPLNTSSRHQPVHVHDYVHLFIYLFIQHLLARPKTANKHERSGDSQPRQAKREKKERCCQRGKGDRERKRKGGTLIIHGITSDETVWKAGL